MATRATARARRTQAQVRVFDEVAVASVVVVLVGCEVVVGWAVVVVVLVGGSVVVVVVAGAVVVVEGSVVVVGAAVDVVVVSWAPATPTLREPRREGDQRSRTRRVQRGGRGKGA